MSDSFFSALNYSFANEDTALELAVLPDDPGHVLCVAGSGGRVVPLLARRPRRFTCVDVSSAQLFFTELRIEAVRALTHSEYLAFWGYPPSHATPQQRREQFDRITLSTSARQWLSELFHARAWGSLLYEGRWERTFQKLARVNRTLTGTHGLELFCAQTDLEHRAFMESRFPRMAWATTLLILGNAGIFNRLLYRGHFPKKNIGQSFFRFYAERFAHLFAQGPPRRNFFLQLVFFGKVMFAEGCPIECDPDIFEKAQAALARCEVNYVKDDVIVAAQRSPVPIDFVSLSDVPSYFTGDREQAFMQELSGNLTPGAHVVLRSYLHIPQGLKTDGYDNVTARFRDAIAAERVGVYTIDVYQRCAPVS